MENKNSLKNQWLVKIVIFVFAVSFYLAPLRVWADEPIAEEGFEENTATVPFDETSAEPATETNSDSDEVSFEEFLDGLDTTLTLAEEGALTEPQESVVAATPAEPAPETTEPQATDSSEEAPAEEGESDSSLSDEDLQAFLDWLADSGFSLDDETATTDESTTGTEGANTSDTNEAAGGENQQAVSAGEASEVPAPYQYLRREEDGSETEVTVFYDSNWNLIKLVARAQNGSERSYTDLQIRYEGEDTMDLSDAGYENQGDCFDPAYSISCTIWGRNPTVSAALESANANTVVNSDNITPPNPDMGILNPLSAAQTDAVNPQSEEMAPGGGGGLPGSEPSGPVSVSGYPLSVGETGAVYGADAGGGGVGPGTGRAWPFPSNPNPVRVQALISTLMNFDAQGDDLTLQGLFRILASLGISETRFRMLVGLTRRSNGTYAIGNKEMFRALLIEAQVMAARAESEARQKQEVKAAQETQGQGPEKPDVLAIVPAKRADSPIANTTDDTPPSPDIPSAQT